MAKLLAPNGKPSNLSPEQYELVRRPEFKAWFGDWENDPLNSSKVIDEETKEPLLVYHGTNEEFNVFSKKGKGNRVLGYFFTTDNQFSKNYGESKFYFLNIKNIKNFNSEKFDSLNTRQNAENNYWQLEKDKLLEENYNGVIIDRNDFFAGINFVRKDYVAFEPNQIKLADGTNTTFDGNNPDIRYNNGGELNNQIEKIAKQVVLDLGEKFSENEFVGKCKEISEEISLRLNKIKIEAIPMRIIDGEDKKYNSPVFNHAYTFLPKTNQIIDTQIWQLEGQPDNLETRKVLFNWDYYNNLIELYEVEPISDWENRFYDGGEIIINPTEIECHTCHWKWKVKDGGDDLFICHKCYTDNTKYYKFEGLKGEKILDTISSNNNNPKNKFDGGGILDGLTEEQITYIDIISNYDGKGALAEKYKKVLKEKTGIDYDEYYGKIDDDLIKNADVNNIKTKNDFLNYDNWIKYSYEILRKRGFDKNQPQHIEGKLTFDKIKEFCDNLNISFEIIPENLGVGNYASHSMGNIKVPIDVNINTFIHEIGHFYDWETNYEGIAKNPAYATSFYYLRNSSEVYAENFMHYFIANEWLKNNMPIVYEELDRTISLEYKKNILELINSLNHLKKDKKIDDKVGKEFWFEYHCLESDKSCDAEIWYRSHQKVKVIGVSEWSFDELQDRIEDGQPRVYSVKFNDGFIADVLEDELIESTNEFYRPDPPKRMKKGGKTISQTPAPKKDQIKGSEKNKEGSAKDLTSAKKIKFSDDVLEKIQNSVDKHNKKHSNKKITIDSAKAVVRRGMGAYSSTHRPTISGGNENSRVAWGLARLNAFMYKIVNGKSKSGKYSQDNDLIEELGYKVEKYEIGGIFQGTPYDFNAYSTEYMGTGEGNQSFGWGLYFTDQKSIAERYAFTPNENSLYINGVSLNNSKQFTQEEKDTILNIWRELWQMGYSKTSNDYLFEFLNEIEQKSILLDIEDESVFDKETIIEINENAKFYNALYDKLKKLDLQINSNVVSVTLFKGKNPNEYDLLEFNKPVNNIQINKIENQAKKEGILIDDEKELQWFRNKLQDGSMIYDWLRQQFSKDYHYIPKSADKQASLFLLRAGIDGIKYKSGTLSGFEDEEGYNYVIFDSDDVTIERKEKYADGGDIQAYEEAMDISEFDEGGEAKPKKVYVSIRLDNDYERISGNLHLFKKYKDESFQELKNQKLVGVRGVSLSKDNVADWFVNRDCLIVMKYDEFILINDTTEIKYDDPYQLMANDLKIFSRLYSNSEYTDKKEKDITRRSNLGKILEKIPFYFDKAKYQYLYEDAQKRDELQRYYYIFADYRHNFIAWIIDNEYIINSPNDLTERLIEFAHLPNSESGIDNYRNFNLEKYVLTTEDLLPIIIQGLKKAGSTYFDEKEVLINDKILNIPTNSQLFFKKSSFENSNLQEVIDRYNLKENYKVYSVDSKRLNDLQLKVMGDRSKIFMNKFEFGKEQLEIKKELVLNDLQKLFFDKSLDKINKILDEKYPSTYYFDWEGEETKYYRWNEVIEVQFLLNKFFEITLRDWKSVFKSKRANDIYSMSFFGIYNSIEHFLREFIEQNRDYLENINKYHNENGDYLWLYDIERAVLGVVSTTWDEGNGISDKQLAKKYFQMIGGELTSYYKQDEIVMPSIYKNGGEADEPTHFWGSEAGGVLVYCSTTGRYLILLRSENVLEPNTWGIISGKLDDDETNVEDAVLREAEEETGYKLGNLIPSFIFEKPNFKFHNFVSIINEEFTPELNWENSHYKWVKLNEMPDNLHFGLKLLLQKEDLPKLVKKHQMENEILIVDMNMYRYNTSVNFKNKEIPLKLNSPKNEIDFIEWAEENNIEFEQWGDTEMIDSSWGYTFEIPLFKYIEYMKTEKFYTGGELKKGIKTEMEHKDTISKIKTGNFSVKQSAKMIAKDHLKENDKYYTNLSEMESNFEEGGKVISIKSKKGDIKISLDENWYSDDTKVELVPVSELIKFREFDRKVKPKYNQDNSRDNINHLKYMFQKDGVKEPLIIEYSAQDNAVLVIEGNHRINSAIDLGMEYLPARVVLKKYSKFTPNQLKNSMKVEGIKANSSNYIPSDLKASQIGITGAKPIYADGGIIEGRLHSECGDDGCGRKFQVGEDGHIIEAERDEAVIVANAFQSNEELTIKGTLSEVASALNVVGGGKNFDKGATIIKNGSELEIPELKKQATNTDVDDIIDPSSIIINRRSMADTKKYEVTGTPKQIASAINSINGNGVVIEDGAEIKEN